MVSFAYAKKKNRNVFSGMHAWWIVLMKNFSKFGETIEINCCASARYFNHESIYPVVTHTFVKKKFDSNEFVHADYD